ncbi:SGNH/GDSL hydrolase family protein [Pseudobacter ginsenosidimutans]|uniref:Lysophospholipase L1-like esterase n=1 Tax=Pseudobacter ginsenosidimutans TaxID=661488 RepID=A0A4Q7N004_9BACT|nr:SGNH/GDSL hydrolase family protein [Pseudobacter ginsenosidimutans]QEC43502.1 SGNH/GDSL hydrolase family protein [Pseudobacter ginsenosidimutans]RZS74890.1 lysophospholipase L1-like esterase [Pseudobacter ginsenosidimutans]
MKKLLSSLSLLIILASFTTFQKPEKIVFFGDSITQAGVNPKGYITVLKDMVKAKGLENKYDLIGAGIGGNKVYDLYLRLEDDVLAKDPSIVVIWVGVNDVWHKRSSGTGTDADKFERFYNAIIKKLKAKNIKVLLCTPAAIGEKTDYSNELDGDLNKYATIIRNIAAGNNCELIDLRKAFLDYNLVNNKDNQEKGILTTDRVHLNDAGNKLVAEEMYKHLIK